MAKKYPLNLEILPIVVVIVAILFYLILPFNHDKCGHLLTFSTYISFKVRMSGLQVIGAGLGRTGTLSMKQALEDLGFNPCHHMKETFFNPRPNQKSHFQDILQENNKEQALEALFGGYKAMVDYPGCMFYEDFMKMNPDAKVILTVRDSPEAWVKSVDATIFGGHGASNWFSWKFHLLIRTMFLEGPHLLVIRKIMMKTHGVDPSDPKTDLGQMYTDWVNRVKETVPAEKLLVFNVKQGWKPLCDFLGVPVPDTPFPRVNSTKEFQANKKRQKTRLLLKFVVLVGLISASAFYFVKFAF